MFRTTLRSASGPVCGHVCVSCLLTPQRLVGGSRYYTAPINENDQINKSNAHDITNNTESGRPPTDQASNSHSTQSTDALSSVLLRGWNNTENEQKREDGENSSSTVDSDQSHVSGSQDIEQPPIYRHVLVDKKKPSSRLTPRQAKFGGREKPTYKVLRTRIKTHNFGVTPEVSAAHSGTVSVGDMDFKALDVETPSVPSLAFGLDRVLFNPGVYHLRDPRSRVYNFDPYLDTIMPVTEFDFKALKEYITSSKDETLIQFARDNNKKYAGSSSSMTGVLSHFHYLLSQWRPLNRSMVSQGFMEDEQRFTRLLRGPSAMFLHYKDGVYAIDADKEYDNANILMNLGKSMEKLLTLPKEEFERYRRSSPNKITPEEENAIPESYHFSTLGDFVMRSQLDAHDPRLPGSGMFDLKTRAVASIRMSVRDYEDGLGYEIKDRFGNWESFEREYFDMIRAAFLKYSLQARIGRMDGIFVAFHNTERIFGFQYIPISEMDHALHGSSNSRIGDMEFQMSIKLWNEILDKATAKFPKQSLRLHFETIQTASKLAKMYIYAQPVTPEQIQAIQEKKKAEIEEYQRQLLYPETIGKEEDVTDAADATEAVEAVKAVEATDSDVTSDTTTDIAVTESSVDAADAAEAVENVETVETVEAVEAVETIDSDVASDATLDTAVIEPSVDATAAEASPKQVTTETETEAESATTTTVDTPDTSDIIDSTNSTNSTNSPDLTASLHDKQQERKDAKAKQKEEARLKQQQQDREDANIFGMTLTIRNTINGIPTIRPMGTLKRGKWKVQYVLKELSTEKPGPLRQLYRSMRKRRRDALEAKKRGHNGFQGNLIRLARKGKAYREEQDRIDREQGVVVYQERKAGSSSSSSAAATSGSGSTST